jgi:hypothetical protein
MQQGRPWYCVIRCNNYILVYLGQEQSEAEAVSSEDTFCAEGPTLGEAQRRAGIGAGIKSRTRKEARGSRLRGDLDG